MQQPKHLKHWLQCVRQFLLCVRIQRGHIPVRWSHNDIDVAADQGGVVTGDSRGYHLWAEVFERSPVAENARALSVASPEQTLDVAAGPIPSEILLIDE